MGDVPGVGELSTLFGFVKKGEKQPVFGRWSVEVSYGGVYFGRLMTGIEI